MDRSGVIHRLTAWARWKMLSGNALGFPKASSFTHLVVDGSRRNVEAIEVDAWCSDTNDAVDRLSNESNGSISDLMLIRLEYLSNVREMRLKLELSGICKSTYYARLNKLYVEIASSIENKYVDTSGQLLYKERIVAYTRQQTIKPFSFT